MHCTVRYSSAYRTDFMLLGAMHMMGFHSRGLRVVRYVGFCHLLGYAWVELTGKLDLLWQVLDLGLSYELWVRNLRYLYE